MANVHKRLAVNVPGDFYVDETCIDCGTCRWMAPGNFDREGSCSRVHTQPSSASQASAALRALVACPVGAIGTTGGHDIAAATRQFPHPITDTISHCGFHHRESYGAASYLIVRPQGNVLVDSPRFSGPLVRAIEALGGVELMFLTHRDDVADHAAFAAHFGCRRVLHADDVGPSTRSVEVQPTTNDPLPLADDLLMIPVPGHTRGSACLLYEGTLFSGDHVAWSAERESIHAFHSACWYDWATQTESMKRLCDHTITRILPGHGAPCSLRASAMREQLSECVRWMKSFAD